MSMAQMVGCIHQRPMIGDGVADKIELESSPQAVGLARRYVRERLESWGLEILIDNAELIVSELATNAVQASTGIITVSLKRENTHVGLAVWDASDDVPALKHGSVDAENGRGLEIVEALAQHWGFYQVYQGKVVWAELAIPYPLPRRVPTPPQTRRPRILMDLELLHRVELALKRL